MPYIEIFLVKLNKTPPCNEFCTLLDIHNVNGPFKNETFRFISLSIYVVNPVFEHNKAKNKCIFFYHTHAC